MPEDYNELTDLYNHLARLALDVEEPESACISVKGPFCLSGKNGDFVDCLGQVDGRFDACFGE